MKHAKLNHNKQFMFGIMAMALVVIGVVILFWLWCFPMGNADTPEAKRYAIHLVGFQGDSLQVSLDDQVLLDGATIDKYTIPMQFEDCNEFGPTWIDVCEMDVLRDQGLSFAQKLKENGNMVETMIVDGAYHAYDSNTGNGFVRDIYDKRISWLLDHLH